MRLCHEDEDDGRVAGVSKMSHDTTAVLWRTRLRLNSDTVAGEEFSIENRGKSFEISS
jgi:hypothetical protein